MKTLQSIKTTQVALAIAVMVAVFLPTSYFLLEYSKLAVILETEAEANALYANQIINANPEFWPFEVIRLQEFLSRRLVPAAHEIRRIRDVNGHIVAQNRDGVEHPFIIREHDLYGSGNLAGKLEVIRSLRPLLRGTALVGVLGFLVVAGVYFPFKRYVLDAREEARRAVRQSESLLASVFASIQDELIILDRDFTVLKMNPAAKRRLGPDMPLVGQKCYSRHGRTEPCEDCPCLLPLETGETGYQMKESKGEGGNREWLEIFAFPLRDIGTGQIKGVLQYIRVITAHKQAEEALRQARREWEEIFQAIGHPTMILDAEHRILEANRATLAAIGKDLTEIRGLKCYEFFHPGKDHYPPECPLEKLHATGQLETMEMEVEALGGTYLVSCTPMLDAAGRLEKVIHIVTDVTKPRRMEQALRQSEQRFKDIAENALEWIWELDARGKFVYASPVVEKLLGYTPEEVLGKHFYDLFHPDDREELKEQIFAAFAAREPIHEFPNRNLHKDGWEVWLSTSGLPILDEAGEFIGYRGADTDITARRRAEQALRESEENYRLLVRQIPALVFKGYADWSIDCFDRKIETLTGYPKEDFDSRRRKWSDLILPDDLPGAKAKLREALKTTGTYIREYRIRQKSDEVIWVHVQGQIFLDAAGKIDHISGVIFDITARKQTEEELARKKAEFEAIFNSMTEGVVFTDLQRRVAMVNPAFFTMFGWSLEEITGETTEFIYKNKAEYEDLGKTRYYVGAKTAQPSFEIQYRRKDGSRIDCETTGTLVNDSQGRTIGFMGIHRDITERKRAREALIASEANYRTIFNAVNDGIFIHDAQTGAVLDVNQNVLDFTGLNLEEIKGLNIEEVTGGEPPYTHKEALSWIQKAAAGQPQIFRWRGKNKSGRQNWWEMNLKRVKLGDKECVLAVARNITGRLLAQEALKESEKRYQSMFEDSPISLWQEDFSEVNSYLQTLRNEGIQDMRGFFTNHPGAVAHCADLVKLHDINKATLELYEAENKEELFQDLRYVLADESYQVFQEILIALADGRTLSEGEGRSQTMKGNKLHVITRFSVIPGFEQTLGRVLVSIIDITERKEAEETMRKYEFITSASKEYMTLINRDYVYEAANSAYCQAHGMQRGEVVGKGVAEIWGTQAFNNIIKKYLDQCFSGRPVEYEGWFRFRAQDVRYYNVSYTPFFSGDGAVAYVAVVSHDITKRKEAEDEKLRLESQLFQSQKMEAIGTLAGGIAHDFNNILASMLGYTELALDDAAEGTDLRGNLSQVLQGCQRAKDLIKQILTFSRQDQQEKQPVQVSLIIKEVLKFLRASLPATIEIHQQITAASGKILANPTQIHQVLLNFCTNAAQAMKEKGGVMDIALAEVDLTARNQIPGVELAPGPYLALTISDTGKGMTPEVMNRIFEPFFTTKAPGQGTGLGLAVVHGIVKSHGGAIQVSSEPGKGSTFRVFFPQIEDQQVVHPPAEAKIPGGRETILLVDDEPEQVNLWVKSFRGMGYQVVGKSSSIEALKAFQAEPDRFDLVITDLTMPQMTGLALAQEMLRLRPELPIILCTGFADPLNMEQIKDLGIREMVIKPLSKLEIAVIIRKVLEKKS